MRVVLILELVFVSLTIALPSRNGKATKRQSLVVSAGPIAQPTQAIVEMPVENLLLFCANGQSELEQKLMDSYKTCNIEFNSVMSRKGKKGKKGKKSKKGKCKKGKCKGKGKGGKGGKSCPSADKLMDKIVTRSKSNQKIYFIFC